MNILMSSEERAEIKTILLASWTLIPKLRLVSDHLTSRLFPGQQVITLVEADMSIVVGIKVTDAGVEHQGCRRSLVSVHNGRMILSEGDGAEHLLALDGVHPDSVEVVALHLHVWTPQQDDGLVVQLLRHQIHQLHGCWSRALGLHGVPQQVAGGLALVLLILLADLQRQLLHVLEEVVVVVLVRSVRGIQEDQHQEDSIILLYAVLGKTTEKCHRLEEEIINEYEF